MQNNLAGFNQSILWLAILWGCLDCSVSLGQFATSNHSATVTANSVAITRHGERIRSVPCDPFMNEHQEQRLLNVLQENDFTDFSGWRLADLSNYLKGRLPSYVNEGELDLLGVDLEIEIARCAVPAGPLGVRLAAVLDPLELTYALTGNRLLLSSRDQIDALAPVRVYDVTPLVLRSYREARVYKYDSLTESIQMTLEPDSWYEMGGTSTIRHFTNGLPGRERGMLIIACPTVTHLRVQALLDRLNGYVSPPLGDASADAWLTPGGTGTHGMQKRRAESERDANDDNPFGDSQGDSTEDPFGSSPFSDPFDSGG